jgi:hypothetical protein
LTLSHRARARSTTGRNRRTSRSSPSLSAARRRPNASRNFWCRAISSARISPPCENSRGTSGAYGTGPVWMTLWILFRCYRTGKSRSCASGWKSIRCTPASVKTEYKWAAEGRAARAARRRAPATPRANGHAAVTIARCASSRRPEAPSIKHKHPGEDAVKNVGSGNAAELATYVVEKGKPLLVLAE